MFQYGIERVCVHPFGLVAKLGYSFLTQLIALIQFPRVGELHQQTSTSRAHRLLISSGLHLEHEHGWAFVRLGSSQPCIVQVLEIVPVQPHVKGQETEAWRDKVICLACPFLPSLLRSNSVFIFILMLKPYPP